MRRVFIYSGLLLTGMAVAQAPALAGGRTLIHFITLVCLSYIMLEVGLEFSADAGHLAEYAGDFGVAAAAATLPWLLCVAYFNQVIGMPMKEAGLLGLFAAATSAGVLFTMLSAAGLRATWVFRKARILAVFDDLVTILLIIPVQMAFIGFHWRLVMILVMTLLLLGAAVRCLNRLFWPVRKPWLLLYGVLITVAAGLAQRFHLEAGVLLPAFVGGCILHHQGTLKEGDDPHSWLDQSIKALFMFLVGCSLPALSLNGMSWGSLSLHVLALTFLSNLGKCFPLLFYRKKASRRERWALSIAMFPRGEVGAGVLLIALNFGITGVPVMLGSLSLAVNLLLTGGFIHIVARLTDSQGSKRLLQL